MATLRDIADRLTLSPSTVSLALRGSEKVNPYTREQVLQVAESLGYVRNHAAASLSSGRSWRIELMCSLDAVQGGFLAEFLRGAHAVLHPAGYSLTLSALTDPAEAAGHLSRLRSAGAVDAVLFTNPTVHDLAPDLAAPRLPAVVLGRPAAPGRVPRVDSDNRLVGADVARHLAGLGHRRVRVLAPAGMTFAEDRAAGLRAAWSELGLAADELRVEEVVPTAAGVARALEDLRETAVVCMSDAQAAAALQVLRARGLLVPEDVSVVGMNDDLAELLRPALTSVNLNAPELGAAAARLVLAQLDGRRVGPLTLVPHALVARGSTAEARP